MGAFYFVVVGVVACRFACFADLAFGVLILVYFVLGFGVVLFLFRLRFRGRVFVCAGRVFRCGFGFVVLCYGF